ncbi:MAG: FHA domain-containing protein [Ardenticatenaceae bacterium]
MTLLLFILRFVFLLLLYVFLGVLAWLVWREIKRGSAVAPGTGRVSSRGERLTVVASGESGYAEGQVFPLRSVTTLGRDLSNDIVIVDDYTSSQHARIERHGDGRFYLVDIGSSNGTKLNGQKISPQDSIPLDPGDVVAIGKVELKVG